jgi:hypothetical protein
MWGSVPTHSLKARALLLCLTIWLAVTPAVYAGGQPEARLADAEKLIQEQDYSAALKLLATIQRNDPNLRDETGRLMSEIMAVTQRYNVVLEDLSKAIEAEDVEKMQQIIPVLHQIDPKRAEGITGQAEVLIGFLKLMNRAEGLLREGRTTDALALYLLPLTDPGKAGFTLPESQFEGAGYGQIITASVKRAIADIVAASQEGLKAASALPGALPAAKVLFARPPAAGGTTQDPAAQFDAIAAPLLQAAAAEGRVRSGVSAIAEIGRSTQHSSSKGREDLFLRYLQWLCLGRESRAEGIEYALRLFWADDAQQMADAAGAAVTASFESARSAYESGGLAAADADFQDIPARSILAAKAAALVSARFSMDAATGAKVPDADFQAMKDALGISLAAQESAAEAQGYRLLIAYRKDLDAMPPFPAGLPAADASPANLAAESAQLASARASLEHRTAEARSQDDIWTMRAKAWDSKADAIDAAPPLAESARHMAALFRSFADTDLRNRDVAYAIRIATIGGASFPTRLDDAEARLTRAVELRDGKGTGQVSNGTNLVARKYPDQALAICSTAATDLNSLIGEITSHEQRLKSDTPYVTGSPGFRALFEGTAAQPGYDALLQKAQSERARIDTILASAQVQSDAAAVASIEGEKFFKDAQDAYASGDTKAASDNLNRSADAYRRSLLYQYSDLAAARVTKDFDELSIQIENMRKKAIIAGAKKGADEIQVLINKPDYPAAKDKLDAAERAWPTDVGPYPYESFRQLIENGLAATQGLTFDRQDHRADVVNALLSAAQTNLSAGRMNEAKRNVTDAQTVAPFYGAARVLELKILREANPTKFKSEADTLIAGITKTVQESNDPNVLIPAYRDLLGYSSLDESYRKQLAPLIQELRYRLKLDPRPPSPQQIAQANVLLSQARTYIKQGTEESLGLADALITQALDIIPNYPPATELRQRIADQRAAATPDRLPPVAQAKYKQAQDFFLSGRLEEANAIVKDLWDNPNNRPYVPLQQLRKRLEVALQG